MSSVNINRVILTGNLTTDPELRETHTGLTVCKLRVASTARRRGSDGETYEDRPNYFNVSVWGANGENAAQHLSKGRSVAIDGRLEWREWETAEGEKRQGVDIIADSVQFLGSPTAAPEQEEIAVQTELPSARPVARRNKPAQPKRRYAHA